MRPLGSLFLLLLIGCGKEAGRVDFSTEGQGEATVLLNAGEVSFWTDLGIDYDGEAALKYEVMLLQGDKVATTTVCDPLGQLPIKVAWVETDFNDSHSRSGKGKMTCSVDLARGGPTTVRAKLIISHRPPRLVLNRADLILRQ